jgi:HD superfamily phosphohydrolase
MGAMIIRDAVHGLIDFSGPASEVVKDLLDTREVQRLRRIRQLGVASLAFPGAEHTRFGHALGTAFVMTRLCRRLGRQMPSGQRLTDEMFAAATAAALLHDVGHPPLSHLFEAALPGCQSHENWSKRVVLSEGTEVGKVLRRHGLEREVACVLDGTHQAGFLSDAMSSPLDVDRFDYLLRDSLHSGVGYGAFDLDWMLSSLTLATAPTPRGIRTVLAVDGRRGLRAVEGYLMARLSMFQQVYFHKTGRAAEFMFKRALHRVATLNGDSSVQRVPVPPPLAGVLAGREPSLDDYLELDDPLLWSCIKEWSRSDDDILARLASGLLNRRLLRTVLLAREVRTAEQQASLLEMVRQATRAVGYDPDYFCGLDHAVDVPYHVDPGSSERIWVVGLGQPGPLTEVSPIVEVLRGWKMGRTIIICPRETRDQLAGELP